MRLFRNRRPLAGCRERTCNRSVAPPMMLLWQTWPAASAAAAAPMAVSCSPPGTSGTPLSWAAAPTCRISFTRGSTISGGGFVRGSDHHQGSDASASAVESVLLCGNNPLRFTDPSGRYRCRGRREDCATIEEAIQKVRTAAANLPAGSVEQKKAAAVAKLYGKLNERTGVVVKAGAVQANAVAEVWTSGFSVFKRTTVTVDLNVARNVFGSSFVTELAAVLGHEMQHGIEQRSGVNQQNSRAGAKARELSAFTTQSYINQGLGVDSIYKIWTVQGGRNDEEIENNAERGADTWCRNGGNCPP